MSDVNVEGGLYSTSIFVFSGLPIVGVEQTVVRTITRITRTTPPTQLVLQASLVHLTVNGCHQMSLVIADH